VKFEAYWVKDENLKEVVGETWENMEAGFDCLSDRLKKCGKMFKGWSDSKFGALPEKVKSLRKLF